MQTNNQSYVFFFANAAGSITPPPAPDLMLFENGDEMLFENGINMLYETLFIPPVDMLFESGDNMLFENGDDMLYG